MACIKCRKGDEEIEIAHLPGKVCRDCFLKIVEKRVRKDVRVNGYFQDVKKILILDDGTENSAVCSYFAKELTGYSKIGFISKRIKSANGLSWEEISKMIREEKVDRMILPWNAEQESEFLLKGMVSKKGFVRDDTRIIKLLKHLSQKEVLLFAKIKGLRHRKDSEPYDRKINRFLGELEKGSPDIRFALISSFEKI